MKTTIITIDLAIYFQIMEYQSVDTEHEARYVGSDDEWSTRSGIVFSNASDGQNQAMAHGKSKKHGTSYEAIR
jgi:lipopolysaccharide assembly outer membrane protein LptD (OstA)